MNDFPEIRKVKFFEKEILKRNDAGELCLMKVDYVEVLKYKDGCVSGVEKQLFDTDEGPDALKIEFKEQWEAFLLSKAE